MNDNKNLTKMEQLIPGIEEPQDLPSPDKEMESLIQTAEAAVQAAQAVIQAHTSSVADVPNSRDSGSMPEQTPPRQVPVTDDTPIDTVVAAKPRYRLSIPRGTLRFYAILFALILCLLILLCCLMRPLRSMLEQYEATNPKHAASEIYKLLFTDPDWALLYDMADIEATQFEGRDEYVAYMEQKVGDRPLRYVEIAADLSGQRRYSIRLDNEEVATFTMIPVNNGADGQWTIGDVDVHFTRNETVTINIMPGQTVYINGVPLDESYTTMTLFTTAENYLPEGVHGYRYKQQQISGLLVQPDVVVLDEYNNPVSLTYNPNIGLYTVPITNTPDMTWGEKDLVQATAKAEVLFYIRAISITQLRQYFDPNSQAYADITDTKALASSYASYSLDEIIVDQFYRYSDDIFSARATVKLDVKDKGGKVTSYNFSASYFFCPNSTGNYMANQRLELNLQEIQTTTRVSYAYRDFVINTEQVNTNTPVFTPPLITDSNGTPAAYWYALYEDGTQKRILVLQDSGIYTLIDGQSVDMMTLYPEFEEITP